MATKIEMYRDAQGDLHETENAAIRADRIWLSAMVIAQNLKADDVYDCVPIIRVVEFMDDNPSRFQEILDNHK